MTACQLELRSPWGLKAGVAATGLHVERPAALSLCAVNTNFAVPSHPLGPWVWPGLLGEQIADALGGIWRTSFECHVPAKGAA